MTLALFFVLIAITIGALALATWWQIRSTRKIFGKFEQEVLRGFDELEFEDFDRLGKRLERIDERLGRINKNLEPLAGTLGEAENADEDEWHEFLGADEPENPRDFKSFKPSEN